MDDLDPDLDLSPRRRRKRVILPTLVTLGNLTAGFLAINYVGDYVRDVMGAGAATDPVQQQQLIEHGEARLWLAAWLIFAGMIFDALDGYVARLTRQQSDFGVELDSICDVVTFGIAPAFLAKSLIAVEYSVLGSGLHPLARDRFAWAFATLYVICAACRLARFNVDTDEEENHTEFVGLPSPGAAAAVAGVVILYLTMPRDVNRLWMLEVQRATLFLAGIAMVSRLRYYHFVNTWLMRRLRAKNMVAVGAVLLFSLLLWPEYLVPAVSLLYLLSGPFTTVQHNLRERRAARREAAKS